MKNLLIVAVLFLMAGCATNYKFGDVSRTYCASTDPEFRYGVKMVLKETGIVIGVDYCTVHGFVDMMVVQNQ